MIRSERAAAAVAAVRAAFVDADSLSTASNQEVADLLALTAAAARLLEAQQVRLAGAIAERSKGSDDDSICRVLGARNARAAIASAFGIRSRDAAELMSMAAGTSAPVSLTGQVIAVKYPRVARALDDGDLSLAQARAILTTLEPAAPRADLDQLAWAEGCLVDAATDPDSPLVPELLVTQARAYVAVLDPDGVLPDSERQRDLRSARVWQRRDGVWRLEIFSPAESGSALKTLTDAYESPRSKVAFTDDEPADAAAGDAPDNDLADIDDRTPQQKRHDIIMSIIEAHAASGEAPVAGGEVPRLVFNGSIEAFDAYQRNQEHADRTLTIEHTGAIVPIETVDRLLCNAVVQRALFDAEGHLLDLGREQRTFNRAQRRALAVKYRGCATPGCGFPVAWTEAHHVVWWQHGGPTDVSNGILLCSHCHHEVHAGRLLVVGTPGDWRVVAQLRPADRYARNRRSGVAPRTPDPRTLDAISPDSIAPDSITTGRHATVAHAAPPPLAIKLPEAPLKRARDATPSRRLDESTAFGRARQAGGRRARSSDQSQRQLRLRLSSSRRRGRRVSPIDHHPAHTIVMRL
ncbi:DUF222 domain-containing protein [Agrococcus sp. ProA11]|uniref:HNH endonuclease signature motif containing protein n=1 Tax=Agrococcus chionoecetis TaxID=3153752 RepID=UPI0032608A7F